MTINEFTRQKKKKKKREEENNNNLKKVNLLTEFPGRNVIYLFQLRLLRCMIHVS